ncbi:MAG TPA: copper homeostasis protein CutC [Verrucomicrobiales bacterium]|nr:copper homeostasis protein CutC [Verrucomicrobiales bacterium]
MATQSRIRIEICVDSVESALAAQTGGADRLELCQNLFEGGTTPSAGMIRAVRRRVKIPLFVILRPRGADFCYSEEEFGVMKEDLLVARELGADGIVTGILRPNGTVDRRRMAELVRLARPMAVTFHRAFDVARDPMEALEALVSLGVERVLSSGQERTVLEGIDLIAELVRAARGRISVMPGGGITERNFDKIRRLSRAREFHLSASAPVGSRMVHRNTRVPMGRELRAPEFGWSATSLERVQAIRRSAG